LITVPTEGENQEFWDIDTWAGKFYLNLNISDFLDDDFYPIGLNYIFNFNKHLVWEMVRAYRVLNQQKNLRKDLEKKFGVALTEFSKTRYTIHSHLVIKSQYGKDAFWNRGTVNHESYFFFGEGMVSYKKQ